MPRPTSDATEGGANEHQTEPYNKYEAPRYLPTPIRVGGACRGSHITNLRKCKWREAPRGVEGNQRWNVYHWPNQKWLRGCSLLPPETSFYRWKGLRILLLGWAMKGPLKKKGKWGWTGTGGKQQTRKKRSNMMLGQKKPVTLSKAKRRSLKRRKGGRNSRTSRAKRLREIEPPSGHAGKEKQGGSPAVGAGRIPVASTPPPHMRVRVHAGRMHDGGGEMGWIHKGAGEANGNGGNGRGGGQPTKS